MLVKIGEAAARYSLSNRTLRYWEEEGILSSVRLENGYRYYDENNILKIKQIIMLRKLRLTVQDIHHIFLSKELSSVIGILQRHLEDTRHEAEELKTLGVILERLNEVVKSRSNLSEIFEWLDLKNALQITLSEKENIMSKNSSYSKIESVRIMNLPKMVFACYRAESAAPENDCWAVVNKIIQENSLQEKYGFRHFGFNNPDPQVGNPVYGYEMWVVVPEDFVVPVSFCRKEFTGGLFASVTTEMPLIGERWGQLSDWVTNSEKYEVDWNPDADRRCLEECIDYASFNSAETDEKDKQLDLLIPIKLKMK
jgi:DNA-binding transcriptional MerR regulator